MRQAPKPDSVSVLTVSQDTGDSQEIWSTRLNASDVLASMDNTVEWDPRVLSIIKCTPPDSVVDFKITWRDPNPRWTSPSGRILLLGDSAHPFLPNSSNGATQAMEDGTSLATCLRLAGKHNIALATRIHTRLR